jgi:hypothetical protein
MQLLREIVDGKSVALVGNAVSLANANKGVEIDMHDVVIRMNLGIPSVIGTLSGNRLELTAGAGLVRGSAVEKELQEVALKLDVLQQQLNLQAQPA